MYTEFILKKLPVVLTQIDRDRHSKTYGCCDRNFWHLKIRDFPSAILQQSGLALALAYLIDFDGNIYYQNPSVKEWAEASVYYWAKIQLPDGSFNEYYPWEHGFPPTAFSLYSSCEIYKRLGMQDKKLEDSIRKTVHYLSIHDEKQAMNQELASITALYSAYTILQEEWILEAVRRKMKTALATQSNEGWFPEYGGADIGYLSVSLDMLAEYYWMSKDESIRKPLERTFEFLSYFIHPDGSAGGEYGSRNTTYFLPNGLETVSILGNGQAETAIASLYANCIKPGFFMDGVDDRYLSHYVMHSFLRALEKRMLHTHPNNEALPTAALGKKVFPEAGLVVFHNQFAQGVISARKGGLLKLFDRGGKESYLDCGYRVNYGKGHVAATNWLDPSYEITYQDNRVTVSGAFNRVQLKVPSPVLHLGLRCISRIFGNRIIGFLKKNIILVDKHSSTTFQREIQFEDVKIIIIDTIKSPTPVTIETASNMSLRHVASGKFFTQSDLIMAKNTVPVFEGVTSLKLMTTITFTEGVPAVAYERLE